ncbi:glycolate oxidase subunit GlcF [Pelagibius litoralis]|uniref:Glycolate oxidase iron-sulfur subunit n=1 Tax=Pelagibius litoralis TaxID=374515 RepID=A0A967C7K4_9PROT|nr:glycolate oxidase subunit GlcF [Pelagibius litoralis]NIA69086.1 glycolate oxidase subunit GlcF [Pelagibius litoralis]
MQTNFSLAQLADPDTAESERILRNCVHCGFCTATCPTYTLLGDELDSPRGRIYLLKDMLEKGRPATAKVVKHIDRCLSCLSCMTTCPSGVHYMHLVDHGRKYIEETFRRPLPERLLRWILAFVLPSPSRFRLALLGAYFAKPFAALMPGRLKGLLAMAPAEVRPPSKVDRPQVFTAEGKRRGRVALMTGCAQKVLAPEINEATVRLLTRFGIEVVVAKGAGCCGALVHHMGKEAPALDSAKANIGAWTRELEGEGLDAVIINASGCGTTVKDYGFMLREDPKWKDAAAKIAAITQDVTEFLDRLDLIAPEQALEQAQEREAGLTVAYHSACSMQHGQQIRREPKDLLTRAGFAVKDVPEGHLCCGSAGTYNLMQPEIAGQLKARKVRNIEATQPDVIATGNIGCMTQIGSGTKIPIAHTVELLDWATGGPKPRALTSSETAGESA